MEVIFLPHVLERIEERGIDANLLKEAVLYPDQVVFEEGRTIAHKKYFDHLKNKHYLLRIVFEQSGEEITIVSAYRTSKIKKYWREKTKCE